MPREVGCGSLEQVRNPHSAPSSLVLRRATDADWPDIFATDARAFLMLEALSAAEQADMRAKVDNADVVLVRDQENTADHPLVGVAMYYRMTMTVPGGTQSPAAGLSWVSVAATHRRRGILRRMITELFDQWEAEDQVFAILTASEATIYERFGFGPTAFSRDLSINLAKAKMRKKGGRGSAPVHYGAPEEIARRVPEIHARWAATRPGALARSAAWWAPILADRPDRRPAQTSGLHYLLHDDGYAAYRIDQSGDAPRAVVDEVVAVTDDAHTELWRVLIGLDLMPVVTAAVPVDDPLPAKLTDHRSVSVTGVSDRLWLRILDVRRALEMRRYERDGEVILEVVDEFRGHGGVFAMQIVDGVAAVAPTTAAATVRMDISVLGSLYLGNGSPRTFAHAGRLWTDTPETLIALEQIFDADYAPYAGTFF